jgi:hypothetical protein
LIDDVRARYEVVSNEESISPRHGLLPAHILFNFLGTNAKSSYRESVLLVDLLQGLIFKKEEMSHIFKAKKRDIISHIFKEERHHTSLK